MLKTVNGKQKKISVGGSYVDKSKVCITVNLNGQLLAKDHLCKLSEHLAN